MNATTQKLLEVTEGHHEAGEPWGWVEVAPDVHMAVAKDLEPRFLQHPEMGATRRTCLPGEDGCEVREDHNLKPGHYRLHLKDQHLDAVAQPLFGSLDASVLAEAQGAA